MLTVTKKTLHRLLLPLALCVLLAACKRTAVKEEADVLVQIDKYTLTRSEVTKIIPQGSTTADSLLIAENYIKKWVTDVLIYKVAEHNLGRGGEEIDRLVEEYRRALLRQRYLDVMVHDKLSAKISEKDKQAYYREDSQRFVLNTCLIRGLFLKVPADAPGLDNVRKWYRSDKTDAVENIEKYSLSNAAVYEYFYDRWVDLDEVLQKMPIQVADKAQFLRTNRSVEATDSTYCYFLNISRYLLAGSVAPYDYARPQIEEAIINMRKVDFLRNFEEELYRDAVRKGDVTFFYNTNPENNKSK